MLIGKVVGNVVATRKEASLDGLKLLLVQQIKPSGELLDQSVVCVDSVGAGDGEIVLFAAGSSARLTQATQNKPVDHVLMAVIDEISFENVPVYQKSAGFV